MIKNTLYSFNLDIQHILKTIEALENPSDRLYGLYELKKRGWQINASEKKLSKVQAFFRNFGVYYFPLSILWQSRNADAFLFKNGFSLLIGLWGKILNKKVIYLDCSFPIPKSKLKYLVYKINLLLATFIISYSKNQIDLWTKHFNISKTKFMFMPYCIDVGFYLDGYKKAKEKAVDSEMYVLAAGRDIGREYTTLVNAIKKMDIKLKLVTLPYLFPPNVQNEPLVEIFQYLSYDELFSLYANALAIVVPLKKGVNHPSGIRAVLESLLIGKPTIATYTSILDEYVPASSEALLYVNAEDEKDMTNALQKIKDDPELRTRLEAAAPSMVQEKFDMKVFVDTFEEFWKQNIV